MSERWVEHDRDDPREPTRAQENTFERLAGRYDRVACHSLVGSENYEAVCLNYGDGDHHRGSLTAVTIHEVEPDGSSVERKP